MSPLNPWTIETIARKEIISNYRAGAWQARRSPDLMEISAGLEYVTAHDMRVRISHAAMDGARAPLDHPCWLDWDPETGFVAWGCRCSVVPIYNDEESNWQLPDPIPDPEVNDDEGGPMTPFSGGRQ
jgi:uncharacterized protein with gpF-like domain